MAYRITINNQPIKASDVQGLQSAEFTYRISDETGLRAVGFGSELKFYGEAYNLIYDEIIYDLRNGKTKILLVNIYDDCCDGHLLFAGKLDLGSLEWCAGECYVTGSLTENDPDWGCLARVSTTADYNGFRSRQHKFVRYCNEMRSNTMHDMYLVFGMLLVITVVLVLKPLALVIEAIIAIINAITSFLGLDGLEITFSLNNEVNNLINLIQNYVVGCGQGHPAFLVREMMQNACDQCGLTFDSSIFNNPNSPYYNTLYFVAPVKEGTFDYHSYREENDPNINGARLLDDLKPVFNADYRIKNGVVKFERTRDISDNSIWYDASSLEDKNIIEKPCFTFTDGLPRYYTFDYAKDPRDFVGNEASFLYNEKIDFDRNVVDPRLEGEKVYALKFAPSRYRRDGIERDVLSGWQEIPFISDTILNIESRDDNNLLLNSGVCLNPKLLIWDGNSAHDNAKILRRNRNPGSEDFHYNYDYWYGDRNNPPSLNKFYFQDENLYDRFYFGEEPNNPNSPFVGWDFTMTVVKTCELLKSIDLDKRIKFKIGNGEYLARINELTVKSNVITIKGTV